MFRLLRNFAIARNPFTQAPLKEMPEHVLPSPKTDAWAALPFETRKSSLSELPQLLKGSKLAKRLTECLGVPTTIATEQVETASRLIQQLLEVSPGKQFYQGEQIYRLAMKEVCVVPSFVDVLTDSLSLLVPAALGGSGTLIVSDPQIYPITEELQTLINRTLKHKLLSHCYPAGEQLFKRSSLGFLACYRGRSFGRMAYKMVASLNECMSECFFLLGSSDVAYLRQDFDEEKVGDLLHRCFNHSGLSSYSIKRLVVHQSRKNVIPTLVQLSQKYTPRSPLQTSSMLNCLIEPESLKSIEEHFKSFAEEKLQVLGGQVETLGHATFVRPAFVVMPPGSKHWRAEVEGPVVLVTTCASDQEALRLMNDSDFGVCSYILTADFQRGEQLARQANSGQVLINSFERDFRMPRVGRKRSGMNSLFGRDGFARTVLCKSIY